MDERRFTVDATEAEARACVTLRVNGTGCRASALPKMPLFRKVSILENPGDSFEEAHPFSKMRSVLNCAPTSQGCLGAKPTGAIPSKSAGTIVTFAQTLSRTSPPVIAVSRSCRKPLNPYHTAFARLSRIPCPPRKRPGHRPRTRLRTGPRPQNSPRIGR